MSSSSRPSANRDERPFDVIVYGATGFTGRLVAEYIAGATHRQSNQGLPPLKWAIGGRDAKKLSMLKASLRVDSSLASEPAVILADADDQQSLQRMTAQTRVVISTVGPYAQHGEPLVAACIKTGTDYCDLTGESPWAEAMIRKYGEAAARNGALIVNMCGYDSIPSDITAFMAASWLRTERQTAVTHMQGYADVRGGGPSGGTVASILYMKEAPGPPAGQSNEHPMAKVGRPYLLNPPEYQLTQARPLEKDQILPKYDNDINKWTVPFVMAVANTRLVRRSLALRRQLERECDGFGSEGSYNECMVAPGGGGLIAALITWLVLALGMILISLPPTRYLLKTFVLPKPGQGPSAEQRAAARFSHTVIARGEDGSVARAVISGGDPGYGDTSKMISEVALMLAQERSAIPLQKLITGRTAIQGQVGGFFTPSLVGGDRLVQRLGLAGLKLEVGEFTTAASSSKGASGSRSSSSKASQE